MEGLPAKQLGVIRSFSRTFQAKLCKFATGAKPAHIKLLCHSHPIRLLVFTGFDENVPAYPPHSHPIHLFNFTGFAEHGLAYPPPAKNAAACFLKRRPPVLLCLFYYACSIGLHCSGYLRVLSPSQGRFRQYHFRQFHFRQFRPRQYHS